MTEAEEIEVGWLQNEAKNLGLCLQQHQRAALGTIAIYIMELKHFPGRKYQAKPTSLAKFLNLYEAQAFVAQYRAAYPKGRQDGGL